MNVSKVRFIKSAGQEGAYPDHQLPEIAFAGRSNCGKSSLINTLVQRKRLARVSSTPGRTQLVNFFEIEERLMLVDLPGYGFAKVPLSVRAAWGPMVGRYLKARSQLRALVLLLDCRRDPRDEEYQLCAWCAEREIPVVYVATKIDKLRASKRGLRIAEIARAYNISRRQILPFSSSTREGRDALWQRLVPLLERDEEGGPTPERPTPDA